jgi:hypothetical protein
MVSLETYVYCELRHPTVLSVSIFEGTVNTAIYLTLVVPWYMSWM